MESPEPFAGYVFPRSRNPNCQTQFCHAAAACIRTSRRLHCARVGDVLHVIRMALDLPDCKLEFLLYLCPHKKLTSLRAYTAARPPTPERESVISSRVTIPNSHASKLDCGTQPACMRHSYCTIIVVDLGFSYEHPYCVRPYMYPGFGIRASQQRRTQ